MSETELKLKKVKKAHRRTIVAGVTAVLCGLFCLLMSLDNWVKSASKDFVYMEQVFLRWSWQYFLVALAFFGLSFGIFRKSRVCAAVLLAFVVIGLVIIPLSLIFLVHPLEGDPSPIVAVGLGLSIPFYLGVRGAFAYHQLIQG